MHPQVAVVQDGDFAYAALVRHAARSPSAWHARTYRYIGSLFQHYNNLGLVTPSSSLRLPLLSLLPSHRRLYNRTVFVYSWHSLALSSHEPTCTRLDYEAAHKPDAPSRIAMDFPHTFTPLVNRLFPAGRTNIVTQLIPISRARARSVRRQFHCFQRDKYARNGKIKFYQFDSCFESSQSNK